MVATSTAKPLSYYISSRDKRVRKLVSELMEVWGSHLQGLADDLKRVFRATLATYQVMEPIWDDELNFLSCWESCLASAGGDDLEVWEDEILVGFVEYIAEHFTASDIEDLITALTLQLRG